MDWAGGTSVANLWGIWRYAYITCCDTAFWVPLAFPDISSGTSVLNLLWFHALETILGLSSDVDVPVCFSQFASVLV